MTTIERLEKKYHIVIRDDSYFHPLRGRFYKRYKIFTADGCQWENGLSLDSLKEECKKYNKSSLVSMHDINQALDIGDTFVFLKDKSVYKICKKEEITPELLYEVYGIKSQLIKTEQGGYFIYEK